MHVTRKEITHRTASKLWRNFDSEKLLLVKLKAISIIDRLQSIEYKSELFTLLYSIDAFIFMHLPKKKNVSKIVNGNHSRADYLADTFHMHLCARTTVGWKCDSESRSCSWGTF